MARTPVVGVTTYDTVAEWGVWNEQATLLPDTYRAALARAGCSPLAIPVEVDPDEVVARLDALVLIGGPDVDPARYGEAAHPATQPPGATRDEIEFALLRAVHDAQKPLLAICRGLEILNVARGGTLYQHLPDVVGHDDHSPRGPTYGDIEVDAVPGTRLATIIPPRSIVGCHHHQAINRLGDGLVVAARAYDGTIEAVEDPDEPFTLAVQWHPEARSDLALFHALAAAATPRASD
jgi:putative glutamine amidotransferase